MRRRCANASESGRSRLPHGSGWTSPCGIHNVVRIDPAHADMSRIRILFLTSLAMLAFAGNSLLCRLALKQTGIDVASFTLVRLASGAAMLLLIVALRHDARRVAGDWPSALALFAYAATFSFAYVSLPAASGALLLFGAVQITMIGRGLWMGERLRAMQWAGCALAFAGLAGLLLPGLSAPSPAGAVLMLVAGVAWGVYSLRGKGAIDPVAVTAGNFLRAVPLALLMAIFMFRHMSLDRAGMAYAIASGALASGVGYAIWYSALPSLRATTAAMVQLSVPLIAALGGIVFLGEPLTLRLALASCAVLGGIALVVVRKQAGIRAP
jgi:drug/metabolite transporter (DMT)-like permease